MLHKLKAVAPEMLPWYREAWYQVHNTVEFYIILDRFQSLEVQITTRLTAVHARRPSEHFPFLPAPNFTLQPADVLCMHSV